MGAEMVRAARAWLAAVGLLALSAGAAGAQQTGTRASGFAYDPASGLLTQEVVEPDLPEFRLQSDYTIDAFGNRTGVTVSGADIATRTATTTYDARGQFAVSATNALSQSESWVYDARFGLPLSHTGPNGLTTSWQYDGFGRKLLEIRADGTRMTWSYRYCSGTAGGTDSCPTGAATLVETKVLAADGTTPIGPQTTAYQDQLGRAIAGDTQGFDGSTIRGLTEYDALGRVARKSRPFFLSSGTPVFTQTDYDVLGRPVLDTLPDNSTVQHAYHGLMASDTNALGQTKITVKNSQGQTVSVTDAENNVASFAYDPFGNMLQATDAAGNVTSNSYDRRGRKIATNDPDMGAWSYSYNVLDQLVSQTDAKGQTSSLTYDLLGRTVQRIEPDQTSVWTYDTAAYGIGKLATAETNGGYQRSHTYDALGRPDGTTLTIDGASYSFTTTYDAVSRVSQISYPSGLTVQYSYNAIGYRTQLSNAATSEVYWTANARDAELRLTDETAGNGVETSNFFDPLMGRLTAIQSGAGAGVQKFDYTYDVLGKLMSRSDTNSSLTESFTYDDLNRLTSATVGVDIAKSFAYDNIGNILTKSDVGSYVYPAAGQPFPHAVSSISGSVINTTFSYDANGNMTGGNGLSLTYASFNKPETITRGSALISFAHDSEHQRFKQISSAGETLYLADAGVMAERLAGAGGVVQWTNYLFAGSEMIGMRVERSDATTYTRYFHKDHLGSIATITDETGAVVERLSYDAWGKRRFPNGQDDPAGSIGSQTTRGFTGQEELADVGLVHMNGRVYDPLLGRFGTPDPTTESPFSTQGWNRYSYVGNSPLNFTDPSGYCFAGCFWQAPFKALGGLLRRIPILGNILTIAAAALCAPGAVVCAGIVSSLTSAAVTGLASGKLGLALKAGLISAATAIAMYEVGQITGHNPTFGTDRFVENVIGHAAVGCASSVASGGKCGPAALSGAVGSFAAPFMKGLSYEEGLVAESTVGGLASVAGGGKFGNGAVTAAFGYLFNAKAGCSGGGRDVANPLCNQGGGDFAGGGGGRGSGGEPVDVSPVDLLKAIAWEISDLFSVAAEEAAAGARGLSGLGGVFSSETNAAGGTIWTSVGDISQNDVAPLVNSGMYNGEVNIISGVHGALNGSTTADLSLYEADAARFGNLPDVNVYNFPEMTPGQINGLLNGPGTTIGGFCNSGACLTPFR